MAYIRSISPAEATGTLKTLYDARRASAGKVWNIVRLMSLSPGTLRASMNLYAAVMHAPSPLSRALREAIAVVVSQTNRCHYGTEAHLHDLRAEVDRAELAEEIAAGYTGAQSWSAEERALLAWCEKIARTPWECSRADVEALRERGFSDAALHDAAQVAAYFAYINRVADALGVDPEPK